MVDELSWSPDGRRIVYSVYEPNAIYVTDWRRPQPKRIVSSRPGETAVHAPRWSPDGRLIVYGRGSDQLWVVKPDGTGKRRLVTANYIFSDPAWSADSKSVAYTGAFPTNLYITGRDGRGQTQVTRTGGLGIEMTWAPQGNAIAYEAEVALPYHPDCGDEGCGSTIQLFAHDSPASPRQRVDNESYPYGVAGLPGTQTVWSRNGTRIAFPCSGICVKTLGRDDIKRVVTGNVAPTDW